MKVALTTEEILAEVGFPTDTELVTEQDQDGDDGWISNIGRDKHDHPESLDPNTEIEVKFRDGGKATGCAFEWTISWDEKFGSVYSIIAYRILKD